MFTYLYSRARIISRKRNDIPLFTPLDGSQWIRRHLAGKDSITSFGCDDVTGRVSDNWFCKVCRRLKEELITIIFIKASYKKFIKNARSASNTKFYSLFKIVQARIHSYFKLKSIPKQISATGWFFHTSFCICSSHLCCVWLAWLIIFRCEIAHLRAANHKHDGKVNTNLMAEFSFPQLNKWVFIWPFP